MGKQFKKKTTIRMGNKSISAEVNVFGGGAHVDYSGFGFHETDKSKAANRRNRKQEERRARMGNWE
jgi:hypothetical protein